MNTFQHGRHRPARGRFDTMQLGRAVGAAGVVCITVVVASWVTEGPPGSTAAAAVHAPPSPEEAARQAEVDRVIANAAAAAAMWEADESSYGMRPDAAH